MKQKHSKTKKKHLWCSSEFKRTLKLKQGTEKMRTENDRKTNEKMQKHN